MIFEMRVGCADELPRCLEGFAWLHCHPSSRSLANCGGSYLGKWAVGTWFWPKTAALLFHNCCNTRGQVAQVVCKIRVEALRNSFKREVAVVAVCGVGKHVVTKPVNAKDINEVEWVDNVSSRLAHFFAIGKQPATNGPALRRLDAGRHQHCRPIHAMETNDVFADEVVVNRPTLRECCVVGAITKRSDVVGKCVEPHVGNVRRIPRKGNAPSERLAAD